MRSEAAWQRPTALRALEKPAVGKWQPHGKMRSILILGGASRVVSRRTARAWWR